MATGVIQPFRASGTVTVAASTSSNAAALAGGGGALLIYNACSSTAFVTLGTDLTAVATTSGIPVPAGARMLVDAGPFVASVAVLLASGSGNVFFTKGEGNIY